MATYKVTGIILNRKNFFEADRVLTCLTRKFGKLKILAKGVRKSHSKNAGSIELFVVCNLILAEGRNFDILASAEIIKSYKNIRDNLSKTALSFKIAELVDKVLGEKQEHEDVYCLCYQILDFIDSNKLRKNNLIFESFALKVLSLVGFAPQITNCVECNKKIDQENNYFSNQKGGILCHECAQSDRMNVEITSNQLKLLRVFIEKEPNIINRIRLSEVDVRQARKLVNSYIEYMIEKELKSNKFEKQINKMGQGE